MLWNNTFWVFFVYTCNTCVLSRYNLKPGVATGARRKSTPKSSTNGENITRNSLVVAGVLAALMAGNVALASDVPTEVTLIEKQTLVRNNGAEVQSEQDTDCRLRGSG